MSWRALFIAASCCICRIIAVLGSEEALSESFIESILRSVKEGEAKSWKGFELQLASQTAS